MNATQAIPEYVERMNNELYELSERKDKLRKFIESEKAENLSVEDKLDLLLQLNAMEEYAVVLKRRLNRAYKREGI